MKVKAGEGHDEANTVRVDAQVRAASVFVLESQNLAYYKRKPFKNVRSQKVPGIAFGDKVRVVLDIGCGAGNVAVYLEKRGAITLSVPGEGSCDNGVQLILERGYPSILQAFDKHRLPDPNQAFDLIHCAACNVSWEVDDGLKLLEADRLLRAGDFFVWIDPREDGSSWNGMENLTEKLCWKLVGKEARGFVWEKPTNHSCYLHRPLKIPPVCGAERCRCAVLHNDRILPGERKKMKGSSVLRIAGGPASLWIQRLRALSTAASTDEFSRGTKFSQRCSFRAADVTSYCQLTGDFNPIHSSTSAAQEAGFSGCVVPGMLCGSLFPAIIGSRFAGAVYVSQTLTFKAPLAVDESFIAEVEVTAVKNLKRNAKITFNTRCFTEEEERLLVEGQAVALLPTLIKNSG